MFPVRDVQVFELDSRGRPIKKMHSQTHFYFVNRHTKSLRSVDFRSLLVKDVYYMEKQYYLMEIMQVEKDIEKVRYIYYNWDWLDFILYQQSLLSVKLLEN